MTRLAISLMSLRTEVNKFAPNRSKLSDGWIGDTAHRSRASRHNPNQQGVVTALDITHDPAHGCDIHKIANTLVARARAGHGHPEFAYVISNWRIASRSTGWEWHRYTGKNGHVIHAHFAVGLGPDSNPIPPYDSPIPWRINSSPTTTPSGVVSVNLHVLRNGSKGGEVKALQALLRSKANQNVTVDGQFGDQTEKAVINVQRFFGLTPDGVVGKNTWIVMFL